ncbi:transcriptional regulator [Nannocystis pusilla]|uniref:Transcriptional regulator n=1 Tax=Nannocystis pusilla TaxID=889268 RepID=A0ABS7U0Z8_9BACT|nr:transcriptional regulator [Nannocystis pusilla]MBZ5713971.1 transcriptional regulator [Nannocystis pusilla]
MAEMPRELFSATSPEGDPLSPGAKVVLAYLWTFVDAALAAAYRHRKGPAKAPRVICDPEEIGKVFQIDAEAVRRHLRALKDAGYAVRHQDDADSSLALLDGKHRDEYLKVFGGRS